MLSRLSAVRDLLADKGIVDLLHNRKIGKFEKPLRCGGNEYYVLRLSAILPETKLYIERGEMILGNVSLSELQLLIC
jgi:hypothetical protein